MHLCQINPQRRNSVGEKTEAFLLLRLDILNFILYFYTHIKTFSFMKKILFLLLTFALVFASCDPKDTPEPKGKLDPNAVITIRPAKGVQLRSTVKGLTALEIVQQAVSMKLQMRYFDDLDNGEYKVAGRGFNEETMKDFSIPALKMLGIDVINAQGQYIRDLTHAKSVFITDINGDTIAYVPDEVINTARPLIESAYADENYTEVYRLFDEAFTFLPISE